MGESDPSYKIHIRVTLIYSLLRNDANELPGTTLNEHI
jgi:hypothetical protein